MHEWRKVLAWVGGSLLVIANLNDIYLFVSETVPEVAEAVTERFALPVPSIDVVWPGLRVVLSVAGFAMLVYVVVDSRRAQRAKPATEPVELGPPDPPPAVDPRLVELEEERDNALHEAQDLRALVDAIEQRPVLEPDAVVAEAEAPESQLRKPETYPEFYLGDFGEDMLNLYRLRLGADGLLGSVYHARTSPQLHNMPQWRRADIEDHVSSWLDQVFAILQSERLNQVQRADGSIVLSDRWERNRQARMARYEGLESGGDRRMAEAKWRIQGAVRLIDEMLLDPAFINRRHELGPVGREPETLEALSAEPPGSETAG